MALQIHDGVDSIIDETCQRIGSAIGDHGWCVTPQFLPPLLVSQLRQESEQLWERGRYRHAGVGRGNSFIVNTTIRNDYVLWFDKAQMSGAQKLYFNAMEQLRLAINRTLYLGLLDFEAHFAIYPKNSYYKKHLDQFRGIGSRTLTAILYLNDHWDEPDGGQLRLYTDPNNPGQYRDIVPHGGTLVTFLSARYLHEVLPAKRLRKSITGWFERRDECC